MKLTTTILKKIIAEEVTKLREAKAMKGFGDMESTEDAAKDAEEVDADEYADSLEHHVDHYKALGLEEARLTRRLAQIHEAKKKAAAKLADKAAKDPKKKPEKPAPKKAPKK